MTADQIALWRILAELSDEALASIALEGLDDYDIARALLAELLYRRRAS
jgi:hypothetical protein